MMPGWIIVSPNICHTWFGSLSSTSHVKAVTRCATPAVWWPTPVRRSSNGQAAPALGGNSLVSSDIAVIALIQRFTLLYNTIQVKPNYYLYLPAPSAAKAHSRGP